MRSLVSPSLKAASIAPRMSCKPKTGVHSGNVLLVRRARGGVHIHEYWNRPGRHLPTHLIQFALRARHIALLEQQTGKVSAQSRVPGVVLERGADGVDGRIARAVPPHLRVIIGRRRAKPMLKRKQFSGQIEMDQRARSVLRVPSSPREFHFARSRSQRVREPRHRIGGQRKPQTRTR